MYFRKKIAPLPEKVIRITPRSKCVLSAAQWARARIDDKLVWNRDSTPRECNDTARQTERRLKLRRFADRLLTRIAVLKEAERKLEEARREKERKEAEVLRQAAELRARQRETVQRRVAENTAPICQFAKCTIPRAIKRGRVFKELCEYHTEYVKSDEYKKINLEKSRAPKKKGANSGTRQYTNGW